MRRAAALALLLLAACDDGPKPFVRAYRAASRDQLIGGVAAVADVGDYVLENDQVRFVILGGHGSAGPGIYGGSLVDADLQRWQPEFRGGSGLDSFSELFPMANLATPNPDTTEVVISDDGATGEEARVTVEALSDNYMDALEMLDAFGLKSNIAVRTDYALVPKTRVLRIDTSLVVDPTGTPSGTQPMVGISEPPDVFGTILRVFAPPGTPAPGVVAGDFLFYGNKTDVFVPGYGFDLDLKLRDIFNGGCDSINVPVGVDALAAEADRVSYAYASADEGGGKTFVPLFASSFTAVMTHKTECPTSAPCLGGKRLLYSRYFALGDGDAASAVAAIYEAKGIPTGTITGNLYDRRSSRPVSGARILVLRDPGADVVSDSELGSLAPDEALARVYEANRIASRRACPEGETCGKCSPKVDPYGEPGIVTSMKSDRGVDTVLDGNFEAHLPPGSYLLVARDRDRPTSPPLRVKVEAGKTQGVGLAVDPPASLIVRVTDETGNAVPAKITVGRCLPECAFDEDCGSDSLFCDRVQHRCFPIAGCQLGECRSYETCEAPPRGMPGEPLPNPVCTCAARTALDVTLGDALTPDNIVAASFAGPDGLARLSVRPGEWEVLVSRGPEYDIARHDVTLDPMRPVDLPVAIHRVVDTTGWVSADFHVHGINSHDANVTHDVRVRSMMGEGVELVSSSDHDAITDFTPAIRRLNAERFIKSQVGLETTTVELGHFIGAPLRFDQMSTGPNVLGLEKPREGDFTTNPEVLGGRGGAFDWDGLPPGAASFCDSDGDAIFDRREEKLVTRGDPQGTCGSDTAILEPGMIGRLRELGLFGPEKTVVTVPHPRDGFFGYFDQFGADPFDFKLRGTTLETLNPLTKPPFFTTQFDAIELFNGKRLDMVRTPTIAEISSFNEAMEIVRSTPPDQTHFDRLKQLVGSDFVTLHHALFTRLDPRKDPPALSNAELERVQGLLGELWVKRVVSRTTAEQDAHVKEQKHAAPLPSDRIQCAKPATCEAKLDNQGQFDHWGCSDGGLHCDESAMECKQDCSPTKACPQGRGECVNGWCERPMDAPCTEHRGVVDDWFRLLNGGAKFTGLANSDTHGLMSVESGLPRNWIRSRTDDPRAIDIGEIAENTLARQAVASYGPFVRMEAEGVGIGGTLTKTSGPVSLHVAVESPLWFDVDRLEIYRNGVLWREVEAGTSHPDCTTVDAVPNKQIVNFDCTFKDEGTEDAWYVANALGLRGKDMRPVYTSVPILFLEIGDITGRAFSVLGSFVSQRPEIPRVHPVLPLAYTNPIWVDRNGDGDFTPPIPLDADSPFNPNASTSQPLSSATTKPVLPGLDGETSEPTSQRLVRELHRRIAHAMHGHGHSGVKVP